MTAEVFVYVAGSDGGGISYFRLDADGELRDSGRWGEGIGATALAASPDRRFLYAHVLRGGPTLASFAIDPRDGSLDQLSLAPASHRLCHLSVDATGRFLLGASYREDFVAVHPIGPGGFVQAEPACLAKPGRNSHCAVLDPSNRFVYVANLGSDQVSQFRFDAATGVLAPNRPALLPTGHASGPRHLVFSPNRRFAYLLTELSGKIFCLAQDAATGALAIKQEISLLPPGTGLKPGSYEPPVNDKDHDSDPAVWAADIHVTPDGRFLYASERTTGLISWFSADPVAGTLRYAGNIRTEDRPRGFGICPRGRFLAVAGEKSDHLAVYAINAAGGGLGEISRRPTGKAPVWVEMVEAWRP